MRLALQTVPAFRSLSRLITAALAIFTLAIIVVSPYERVPVTPSLAGYSFRQTISVNQAMVPACQDLPGFPVIIDLQIPPSDSFSGRPSFGQLPDLCLTKSDGLSPLPFVVDSFDPDEGVLRIRSILDTLSHSGPNRLWIYYGAGTSSPVLPAHQKQRINLRFSDLIFEDQGSDRLQTHLNNLGDPTAFWACGPTEVLNHSCHMVWGQITAPTSSARKIVLNWRVEQEKGQQVFALERSLGDFPFQKITDIHAGTTCEASCVYRFTDHLPDEFTEGKVRYRLLWASGAGSLSGSPPVEITVFPADSSRINIYSGSEPDVVVVPIPVSSTSGATLRLVDSGGSTIAEELLGPTACGEYLTWYPPQDLHAGDYLLELSFGHAQTYRGALQKL